MGGGVENNLNFFGINAPGWFMKTEYRAAYLDRKNLQERVDGTNLPTGFDITFKPFVQTISTSLVYRFNWSWRSDRGRSTDRTIPSLQIELKSPGIVRGFFLLPGIRELSDRQPPATAAFSERYARRNQHSIFGPVGIRHRLPARIAVGHRLGAADA